MSDSNSNSNSIKAFLLTAERVLDGCRQLERRVQGGGLGQKELDELRRMSAAFRELGQLLEILVANADDPGQPLPVTSQAHILIVDDDENTRKALTSVLRMADFDVITASNGVEAVIAAHNLRPALIIMDIMMPVLGGIEATRLLKAIAQTSAIPVIAHTGRPEECRVHEPALFACILAKPIEPDALAPLVSHYVGPRMLD